MVKERPVTLSAPMVRAILAGVKTQHRFPLHPQPAHVWGWGVKFDEHDFCAHVRYPGEHPPDPWVRCPYGAPPHRECGGDRLWVRETWQEVHPIRVGERYSQEGRAGIPGPPGVKYRVVYRADGDSLPVLYHASAHPYRTLDLHEANLAGVAREDGWNPSIHMPRWASRLTLEITSIRVERLQDISASDALAEGCSRQPCARCDESGVSEGGVCGDCAGEGWHSEVQVFRALWNHINGKRGYPWSSNPWVWMLSFSRAPTRGQGG